MTASADRAVHALIGRLAAGGVRHLVIAPGSRNTPLTLAATRAESPVRPWLHLDERSAAYFALGLARQTGAPVAVSCTSGTAAANFLPAAVEASLSRVPLLLLTADRPPELRDIGAPQTIDQVRLYGGHAKWAADLPPADGDEAAERAWAAAGARSAALALAPPAGPVHLNLPFREPLVGGASPAPSDAAPSDAIVADAAPFEATAPAARRPDPAAVERLAARIAGRRGLIVCGPGAPALPAEAIVALAEVLGWPVLADPLSGLRAGSHRLDAVVETSDALARVPEFTARAAPEVVLRFGAAPTSKPLNQWLASVEGASHVVVDPAGGWRDPDGLADAMVEADEGAFCAAMLHALPPAPAADTEWLALWREANAAARGAMREAVEALDEPFEGRAALDLADALPAGSTLVVGNSMPVRDIDSFFPAVPREVRLLGTRGASGIDGVVSTAVGTAAAEPVGAGAGPVALLVGDLSFVHDLNGLWPVRRYGLNLTVVLVNNDGGGIFHFLPQREAVPERFEEWWGTPHGLDLRHAVALHGGRHEVLDAGSARDAIAAALVRPGLDVLELRTERERNVALHRQVWAQAAEAVRAVLGAAAAQV